MNRRRFIAQVATLPLAASIEAPGLALSGEISTADTAFKAGSDFGRYRLTLDRVLSGQSPAYTPDFLLEDILATPGRRFTNFSGDTSGRWIGALSTSARVFGDSFPTLHDFVHRVIPFQRQEGYFGSAFHYDHPDDNDMALLWGNGRLLVGFMEYYALTRDPGVLISAKRIGDFLLRIAPHFNSQAMADAFSADHYASSYVCWTQQTEGLAALYAVTRDDRYQDLCAAISLRIERRPGDHVHGYLTSLRGVLELYRLTSNSSYLNQVIAAWKDIQNSGDTLITGGVPERWSPRRQRTEGCAECDWLRLNLGLYSATGDRVYLDTAQNTYFNEFSMNQFATGDYGHARLDSAGVPEIVYVRAWWCCTLHGLRAFAELHNAAFRIASNEAYFDFPIDSQIRTEGFSARAQSALAEDGTIRIEIQQANASQRLIVFKPSWADNITIARNGNPVRSLTVEKLSAGDVILINYGMSQRVGSHASSAGEVSGQCLHFGPWLIGATSSANPEYFNELCADNRLDLKTTSRSRRAAASIFEVPMAESTVPYIPAEFPEQPAQVELRAVAEQTAHRPANWQLVFAPTSTPPSKT
ncbi:MAG: beta-L-arabinofuranosidase domain-containing protein [Terracidiphilus sp.]